MHSHTRDRHSHSLGTLSTMSSSDRARGRPDESACSTSSPSVAHQLAALIGLAHDESDSTPHPAVERAAHGLHIDADLARRLRHNPAFGLQPGDIVHHDCREGRDAQADAIRDASREVRMVQWNIERGYKLAQIIEKLKEQDADVIALQEVDIGCARSDWLDTGLAIAQALQMNYTFVTEFLELYSPMRPHSAQGGGVHGNAILSRYAHTNTHALCHAHQPFHWESRGHQKKEPRLGRRYTLLARVDTHAGKVDVYSAHLEVFSGVMGRLQNFAEILDHARGRYDACGREDEGEGSARGTTASAPCAHQAILGDFNTLSHGIARLSPHYCTDSLRWGSLGFTEAEWWTKHVLTRPAADAHSHSHPHPHSHSHSHRSLRKWLPEESLRALANPGFYCPFDAYQDATLTNYRGWFQGKLDWMLLRNLTHTSHWLSNNDYSASDHKLLGCSVMLDEPMSAMAAAAVIEARAEAANASASAGRPSPVWPVASAATSAASSATATAAAAAPATPGGRTLRSHRKSVSGSTFASSSAAADDASTLPSRRRPLYATKNSSSLRKLMPLTRPGPGIVTSSAAHPHIYVSQIVAFAIAVIALLLGLAWAVGVVA